MNLEYFSYNIKITSTELGIFRKMAKCQKGLDLEYFSHIIKIQVQNNYIKLVILTKLKKKGYQRKREKYMLKLSIEKGKIMLTM